MEKWPRISVVTPSFNQGSFIAETVESVLAQNYPNLEHIVIDGGSTDNTLETLKGYSHLRVISEPDNGQSEAINKGFRLATGKVWGFLNSDDTLLAGALHRVAKEIDPKNGRYIVMGRCRFIDDKGVFFGVEHPSHFESHYRVLKIWKGHMIPQPSVFWAREVWEHCGGMDETLKSQWIDYDLFCRFSRKYDFHFINQLLATYRLHKNSKSERCSVEDRLEEVIGISRRYWGSPFSIMYWQLLLSLKWYRFNRVGRSRALYQKAREASRQHQTMKSIFYTISAAFLSPEVAFYVGVYPAIKKRSRRTLNKFFDWYIRQKKVYPQTKVYLERTVPWEDDWIGPRLVVTKEVGPDIQDVIIQGTVDLRYIGKAFTLTLFIDRQKIGAKRVHQNGVFTLDFKLTPPLSPGKHTFEIQASSWWVHHQFYRSGDYRPLAWKIAKQDGMMVSSGAPSLIHAVHNPKNSKPEGFTFKEGWHDAEFSGLDWMRWSSGRGEIKIICDHNVKTMLRTDLCSICYPNMMDILVNGEKIETLELSWEGFKPFCTKQFHLGKGQNIITIVSHNEAITPANDSRHLAIALRNAIIEVQMT
jgi:glycosyltransferase involved in cell wall biosynthesis